MATTRKMIQARVSEDYRQPVEIDDIKNDLSNWAIWEIETYLFDLQGNLLVTADSATSTNVKTAAGKYFFWFKSIYLDLEEGEYFYQSRRIDADNNIVILEGPFILMKFPQPA